jgi:ribosomal protein S12 methylthiotransferase
LSTRPAEAQRVKVVTLGCPKNVVDSEAMMGFLARSGYVLTDDAALADVLVVNTCAFIEPAKEESIEAILDAARWKEGHPEKRLIVAGCLAQRYADELAAEMPEVDAFVGTSEFMHVADVVEQVRGRPRGPVVRVSSPAYPYTQPFPRVPAPNPSYAYLKIAEGCDHRCTFCAIPSFRGAFRSRPMDVLLAEAQALAASGVKELVLISQDTTFYGRDLYGEPRLPRLLRLLSEVDGVEWIRTLYLYPSLVDDALLDAVAETDKVCPYLDIPLQHVDDTVLRRMGRGTRGRQLRALVEKARRRVPGVALRTSFIVGFPGETDEQFERLVEFVVESRLEHVGAFPFSAEEGTPAGGMHEQVPDEVKEERLLALVAAQSEVAREMRAEYVGRLVRVLVDHSGADAGGALGRMATQAPEIDDVVLLRGSPVQSGTFVTARIAAALEFDLVGEVAREQA